MIGATTSLFSIINSVLLRPPIGDDSARQVRMFYGRGSNMVYTDYVEHRDASRTMDLAAFDDQRVSVRIEGATEAAFAEMLTPNYFQVAGVRPAIGRLFDRDDGSPGARPVAVVSDGYWRRRLDRDPAVIGRSVPINGVEFSIVGVAPPAFVGAYGFMAADLWLPITTDPLLRPGTNQLVDRERSRSVQVLGRLRPGITLEQARADAALIAEGIQARFPSPPTAGASLQPATMLPDNLRGQAMALLGLLLGLSLLLLAAACASVGNMLLARRASDARDIALRQAIGASRLRIVAQLLTERLLLSGAATAAALAATWLAMVTTIACGLAPALSSSRSDLTPTIHRRADSDPHRLE